MTIDEFRNLALALPEAVEAAHMNHPDFRVRGKIFATLWPEKGNGVVMLTPEQQEQVIEAAPAVFAAVPGGWGRRGATVVHLKQANEATVGGALLLAWGNKAP